MHRAKIYLTVSCVRDVAVYILFETQDHFTEFCIGQVSLLVMIHTNSGSNLTVVSWITYTLDRSNTPGVASLHSYNYNHTIAPKGLRYSYIQLTAVRVFCDETLNSVINSVLVAWTPPSPDINLLVFYLSDHLKNNIYPRTRGVGLRIYYTVSFKQKYVQHCEKQFIHKYWHVYQL